jgi:hypothetical protein
MDLELARWVSYTLMTAAESTVMGREARLLVLGDKEFVYMSIESLWTVFVKTTEAVSVALSRMDEEDLAIQVGMLDSMHHWCMMRQCPQTLSGAALDALEALHPLVERLREHYRLPPFRRVAGQRPKGGGPK